MSAIYHPQDIHNAITAAQIEASTVPLREDENDDETIRARPRSEAKSFDSRSFEGFKDFELDLSCLSPPASPSPSTSDLPPDSPSPPPTPPPVQHTMSRTRSFASQAIAPLKKSSKKVSSGHLSSMTLPGPSRGSWPIIKYTGRGTPIDRNRNREWGGFISEEEEVGEDGVLFSTVRSASLDSHVRPSQKSLSPEWNYLPPLSISSSSCHATDEQEATLPEPPPELAPINLGTDQSDDWESIIQTVLGSTDPQLPDSEPPSSPVETVEATPDPEPERSAVPPVDFPMMTPDQIEELHNGLESHLGIHQALDLGLGINITQGGGKMNLFKLGLLPSSASGRETPSIYSQAETPRVSPPATIIHHDNDNPGEESENRSATSTTADHGRSTGFRTSNHPWWRKVLKGLRGLQEAINHHKHRLR